MRNKGRLFVLGIVVIVFLIINSFTNIVEFITNYLWFKEVGYTQTFFTKIKAQIMIGIPIFIILSILLYIFIKIGLLLETLCVFFEYRPRKCCEDSNAKSSPVPAASSLRVDRTGNGC